jgi:hypothetical protein
MRLDLDALLGATQDTGVSRPKQDGHRRRRGECNAEILQLQGRAAHVGRCDGVGHRARQRRDGSHIAGVDDVCHVCL